MSDDDAKRPAYEPADRLLAPLPADPRMPRSLATTAGAVLVLLRVVAGVFVLMSFALGQPIGLIEEDIGLGASPAGWESAAVALVVGIGGGVLLVVAVLAVLIHRGHNAPRVVVMVFAALSISGSFAAWWFQDQEITFDGALLSLGLDILVLLALSSRSAAAYARRGRLRDGS